MLQPNDKLVMDVLPWPSGQGFAGAQAWWDCVLSKNERQKLDNLLGIALLDQSIRDNLLTLKSEALLSPFEFSEEVKQWLMSIEVASLEELAEAILKGPAIEAMECSL